MEQVEGALLVSNKALSYTPPTETMREIFQKQMKNRQSGRPGGMFPGSRSGRRNPFQLPDDVGRIFTLQADGTLSITIFKKGATDGLFTEIRQVLRGKLELGTRAVTGIEKKKTKKTERKNTLLPGPGGRR
jgi:hypothetical protein